MTLSTTTIGAIRDAYTARLVVLTPTTRTTPLFKQVTQQDDFERLLTSDPCWLRKFDWEILDGGTELGLHWSTAAHRRRPLGLVVAYPAAPALYGRGGLSDLEALIDADAMQLLDVLASPDNYIDGQNGADVSWSVERRDTFWLLRMVAQIQFYEPRSR